MDNPAFNDSMSARHETTDRVTWIFWGFNLNFWAPRAIFFTFFNSVTKTAFKIAKNREEVDLARFPQNIFTMAGENFGIQQLEMLQMNGFEQVYHKNLWRFI